jgi:predicted CXXCH cytochrome family protein
MRTLKVAFAAVAALAFNSAMAQQIGTGPIGMGAPPGGAYEQWFNGVGGNGGVGTPPGGQAFHAGGVAACDGCHVMHNANGGVAKSTTGRSGEPAWNNHTNAYLLQGGDQSSTCLICHGANSGQFTLGSATQQFVVATLDNVTPATRSPGGDFAWTRLTFGAATNGAQSLGASHGHNVAAADFGWDVDSRFSVAPGGTFTVQGTLPTEKFACSSCHDPHGRYRMQNGSGGTNGIVFAGPFAGSPATLPIASSGSYGEPPTANYAVGAYRLLAGQRYAPASKPGFAFANNPPVAVAPASYNKNEDTTETRVNYATGMSEWCQNCHANIHLNSYASGWAGLRHPAGSGATLHAGQYNVYNSYISSGRMTGTNQYTSLVPFEQGPNITIATLAAQAGANTAIVAGATSNVMCLSCHRAHASAFDSMVRWDQNATFLTNGATGQAGFTSGVTTRTADVTQAGYYGRGVSAAPANGTSLGFYQRSLCNKCHGKD